MTDVLIFWMEILTTVILLITVNKKGTLFFFSWKARSLVINRAIVYTENVSQYC